MLNHFSCSFEVREGGESGGGEGGKNRPLRGDLHVVNCLERKKGKKETKFIVNRLTELFFFWWILSVNRYSFNWRSFAQLKFFSPESERWAKKNNNESNTGKRSTNSVLSFAWARLDICNSKERATFLLLQLCFYYALFKLRCKTITSLTFYIQAEANRCKNFKQSQLFYCLFMHKNRRSIDIL